jgi:hypothetical protein
MAIPDSREGARGRRAKSPRPGDKSGNFHDLPGRSGAGEKHAANFRYLNQHYLEKRGAGF